MEAYNAAGYTQRGLKKKGPHSARALRGSGRKRLYSGALLCHVGRTLCPSGKKRLHQFQLHVHRRCAYLHRRRNDDRAQCHDSDGLPSPLAPAESGGLRYNEPVTIGKNVWLASGVTVLPGIHIGDNAVIGACSVVTKDIPPNVLAVGSPARILRSIGPEDDVYYRHGKRIAENLI